MYNLSISSVYMVRVVSKDFADQVGNKYVTSAFFGNFENEYLDQFNTVVESYMDQLLTFNYVIEKLRLWADETVIGYENYNLLKDLNQAFNDYIWQINQFRKELSSYYENWKRINR